MKKETALQIICSLLILLFAYTGFSKLANHAMFAAQLTKFPLLGDYATFFSLIIPLAELVVVGMLFLSKLQMAGFYVSAMLLCLFTLFLIMMLRFDKNLPCSCGGVIAKLSWAQHIAFNLFFLVISIAGIWLKRAQTTLFST